MIQTIIYRGFHNRGRYEILNLTRPIDQAIKKIPEYKRKASLFMIVNKDALPEILQYKDLVYDRKTKHPAKPLKDLLLGMNKIPVLMTGYTSTGKIKNAVKGFMKHVYYSNETNLYIIGIGNEIFAEFFDEVKKQEQEKDNENNFDIKDSALSEHIIKMLKKENIPDELNKNYFGNSTYIKLVKQLIMSASKNDDPVLIQGESGTGKSLIAYFIHIFSKRKNNKFRTIKCSAIPSYLLEAELFGLTRNSYSEVTEDKDGLWFEADGGTLFLDEIGDLALDHQLKVLRAIQKKKIVPLGSDKEIDVNTRLIAATNRDLDLMVQERTFREDLYYHLRDFSITMPPLRQHKDDIPDIADAFWNDITKSSAPSLSEEVLSKLENYDWPGNGRELKTVLNNLYSTFRNKKIKPEYLAIIPQFYAIIEAGVSKKEENELIRHSVECLRHLKQTDEVMRAIKVALRPVIWHHEYNKNKKVVSVALRKVKEYLNEMEMLLLYPIYFHSQDVFLNVRDLNGLMRDELMNKKSGTEIHNFWQQSINEKYDKTHEMIFSEVRWLEKLARREGNEN